MDKKLKILFEYQKFVQDPTLEEVIKDVSLGFGYELSDDALFAIAGGKEQAQTPKQEQSQISGNPLDDSSK